MKKIKQIQCDGCFYWDIIKSINGIPIEGDCTVNPPVLVVNQHSHTCETISTKTDRYCKCGKWRDKNPPYNRLEVMLNYYGSEEVTNAIENMNPSHDNQQSDSHTKDGD